MLRRFQQFSASVAAIHRDIQKIQRDEMEKYGLKGAFAPYLVVMMEHPDGITAAELSQVCDKDKAAISRVAAELEEKGLITRNAAGEKSYRAPLRLTEQGLGAAEFVCRQAQAAVQAAGQGLSEQMRMNFYAALQLIAGNLSVISKRGIPPREEQA